MPIQQTDDQANRHATGPRVTLADIEGNIRQIAYMSGSEFLSHADTISSPTKSSGVLEASILTICMIVMKNGYMVVGVSAPASPENFDVKLGQRLAYEKCIAQIWPLMGYELRSLLSNN